MNKRKSEKGQKKASPNLDDTIKEFENSAGLFKDFSQESLILLRESREELGYANSLLDNIVNNFLDIAKLFIGLGVPALLGAYIIKGKSTVNSELVWFIVILVLLGIVIFAFCISYKLKKLKPSLKNSVLRSEVYMEMMKGTLKTGKTRLSILKKGNDKPKAKK